MQDDLGLPNGLTFDVFSSQLCWVDAGDGKLDTVQGGSQSPVRGGQTRALRPSLTSHLFLYNPEAMNGFYILNWYIKCILVQNCIDTCELSLVFPLGLQNLK